METKNSPIGVKASETVLQEVSEGIETDGENSTGDIKKISNIKSEPIDDSGTVETSPGQTAIENTGVIGWANLVIKKIAVFLKKTWNVIRNYWLIICEWFGARNMTRTDKWAFVVCVFFSFTIWLYVMNTNDTSYEKSITYVMVNIEGTSTISENGMSIISGYDNNVTITLKGKRSDIGDLTADDIKAYVDMSEITETGRHTLPVKISLPENSSLISIEPSSVSVSVDINTTVSAEIKVKLNYAADSLYTIGEFIQNHYTVSITGPKSVLDDIEYAAAVFNPGVITTSLTLSGSIALYNEFDQIIENPYIKMSVKDIVVKVPVTIKKTVPVTVTFTNGISSNFKVSMTPADITLIGDPQILNSINEISVYTINSDTVKVGEPYSTYISIIETLPPGVVWENSEHGILINIERLY